MKHKPPGQEELFEVLVLHGSKAVGSQCTSRAQQDSWSSFCTSQTYHACMSMMGKFHGAPAGGCRPRTCSVHCDTSLKMPWLPS